MKEEPKPAIDIMPALNWARVMGYGEAMIELKAVFPEAYEYLKHRWLERNPPQMLVQK